MSFDWTEYLKLARYLHGEPSTYSQEAAYRSAASRAYYAAFCHARNYAQDQHGFAPNYRAEDHKDLRSHFECWGMGGIARKLDSLRQWRNRCDYRDTVSNISRLAASAIKDADAVISRLP